LNVHGVNDVRQTEVLTAGPLVSKTSPIDVGITIVKFRRHISRGIYQILSELIQQEGKKNTLQDPQTY